MSGNDDVVLRGSEGTAGAGERMLRMRKRIGRGYLNLLDGVLWVGKGCILH